MKLKRIVILLCAFLFLFLYVACGAAPASREPEADYVPAVTTPAVSNKDLTSSSESTQTSTPINQKLIRTVYMDAETEDLDALLANVESRVAALGGYVESRQVYNGSYSQTARIRNATLTIRIPAPQLDSFVDHVSETSNIVSTNETSEDVTLSYVEVEGRVTALETQQARLLELLAQAETMEDLLTIERELTDVRTELEQMKSRLRVYDNLVDYGTVHLDVEEVKEFTVVEEAEPTFWERISEGFSKSMENVGEGAVDSIVLFITCIPYFLPLIVVAVITLIILRFTVWRKKKPKDTDKKA